MVQKETALKKRFALLTPGSPHQNPILVQYLLADHFSSLKGFRVCVRSLTCTYYPYRTYNADWSVSYLQQVTSNHRRGRCSVQCQREVITATQAFGTALDCNYSLFMGKFRELRLSSKLGLSILISRQYPIGWMQFRDRMLLLEEGRIKNFLTLHTKRHKTLGLN